MKNFKKYGWFLGGIPVFLIITYNLTLADVHPLFIACWSTVMAGFIGYSLCDSNVFKK